MAVIKIEGEVSSVTAAVLAAKSELDKYEAIWSVKVIARPSEDIELLTRNKETVGYDLITKKNLAEELNNDNQKKESKDEPTCNMCNDPKCPREKGDLRKDCIHYDNIEE
jgi:microcompartment protein CcmL/EutN